LSIDFDKGILNKLKIVNASQEEAELHREYLKKIKH
jgi:DNA polymerase-3 subunit epsilon